MKKWGNEVTTPEPESLVFVVDDDEHVRNALSRLLRATGHRVEAYDSATAFMCEADLKCVPACLLLDVQLPDLSGIELQRQLQSTVPIVFISAYDDFGPAVAAMKAGAIDFLFKPVEESILLEAAGRALECAKRLFMQRKQSEEIERRIATLTPREREVMELVVTGLVNKVIAYELGAAEKTIKIHRARMMEKMRADSVANLVHLHSQCCISDPPTGRL
ncbi:response regulator transcription factor [Paraburkholderia tropica]|uniref:response regulator transcription factor n=1 Tax=Paraburkholderia tropica TaxID=92647 RepID=UPI0007EDCAAA|nr:response regulator [Paraburkholderia tropica]OBR46178.1 DNA-binding response regulator [Paraburkholderia tropica]